MHPWDLAQYNDVVKGQMCVVPGEVNLAVQGGANCATASLSNNPSTAQMVRRAMSEL